MSLTKVFTKMIADTAVSVRSYGAVGDGVTDDSAAINAAIDDLGYAYLSTPDVSYYIESPIIIGRNQRVFGDYQGSDETQSVGLNPTILTDRGIPAIWVQDFYGQVSNVSIKIKKADPGDFTNPLDVGVLLRSPTSFSPTPVADWPWVGSCLIDTISVTGAYMSIQMESVYRITLNEINTYWDKFGVSYNYDQRQIFGPSGALPRYATTMWYHNVYCRGAAFGEPREAGGYGFWGDQTFGLTLDNCAIENYDTAMRFFNTHSGSMRNLYSEICTNGCQLIGNLSPFIVDNSYVVYRQAGESQNAVRGQFGTTVFIGGEYVLQGGPSVVFSPIDSTGTCTFVTHPALNDATLTPTLSVDYFRGGMYDDGSLVINDSLTFSNTIGGFVTGVPVQITQPSTAVGGGGFIVVTGYSADGLYKALLTFMPGSIEVVSEVNNTGGTVAYTTGVNDALYVTSSGTSAQIFDQIQVKGILN
jgi:hypothetical protein